MKKELIQLNSDVSIDLEKLLESRMVILANSGGGKSFAIRKVAEETVEKRQVIIIDPEGEFASLREKFDFILAGKNADVPVEVRSAALLATKLLELGKSAVIDLYELSKQDRQRYVKLFFNAMVDAPKELYHPVFVILDEAHDYAPEGKPSEATQAVEDLASKGRKRGYCLIPASQRISKLSKNVSAECNNKLIGRASQDLDMKRAGDELGFAKGELVRLRQLQPGEFFAFGPAISDEIIKLKIGSVKTAHNKVSYKNVGKVPPASEVIRKVLGELKDLPQEAEKEAKTVAELKKDNAELKRQNTNLLKNPFQKDLTAEEAFQIAKPLLDALRREKDEELNAWMTKWQEQIENWMRIIIGIGDSMKEFQKTHKKKSLKVFGMPVVVDKTLKKDEWHFQIKRTGDSKMGIRDEMKVLPTEDKAPLHSSSHDEGFATRSLGRCARVVYTYLLEDPDRVYTKTQVAVATLYSQNSGGFNNALSELASAGLITRSPSGLQFSHADPSLVLPGGINKDLSNWLPKLGACARAIWTLLLDDLAHDTRETWPKEDIAMETDYSVTSGGFNNALSELSSLGLIERLSGGVVRVNPEILNL